MKNIYEDNHLLIVSKPPGSLTQPSGTEQNSLEVITKAWIKQNHQKPGNVFLEAIHRLDKPVSGMVLFAKTSKALSRLNAAMRLQQVKKHYQALVEGVILDDEGKLKHYLIHDDFCAQVVDQCVKDAKCAQLRYRVIRRTPESTLVEIELETGRYHQIRAQFSAIGHPVVADTKYGSMRSWRSAGIALHHYKLSFPHPITREILVFEDRRDWYTQPE